VSSDQRAANIAVVERFLASLSHRWPSEDELAELLDPGIRFVERPNLVNPRGSERDAEAMRAGLEAGKQLLAWQSYDIRDHVAEGNMVVTRMRWTGELAVDAGPWEAGTKLSAWCVAHYTLKDDRIAHIEQHDCYDEPQLPG
jgi:SnoaL-like protein